jgi:CRP/FNR family transcriptional regulator
MNTTLIEPYSAVESAASMAAQAAGCANCASRGQCLPEGLRPSDVDRFEDVVVARHKVRRGEVLVREGATFNSIYAVRSGFFKSVISNEDGRAQVTGFQMAGDYLGMEGVASGRHVFEIVALEEGEVCVLPFAQIEALARDVSAVQRHVHRRLGSDVVRESRVMLMLGSMRAEERIAKFLLGISSRLQARGYSRSDLLLRMKRDEMGSFLSLKLETVSRTISKFVAEGVLAVNNRQIQILDMNALKASANFTSIFTKEQL